MCERARGLGDLGPSIVTSVALMPGALGGSDSGGGGKESVLRFPGTFWLVSTGSS